MAIFINLNKTYERDIKITKAGDYVIFMLNLSGSFAIDIAVPHANVDIFGLYHGRGNEKYEVHTLQRHSSPEALSNLYIKGVFESHSSLDYRGLIRIEKDAQKSHAYQKNQNLIVSENATVNSKPYLEILANDVYCTHGSTTGKLNMNDIFYLQTRGASKNEAEKLLIDGFLEEIRDLILRKVPNVNINELKHA